ncbi:MAG: sensor histidine kinase [Desulfuromonadales bacterium]
MTDQSEARLLFRDLGDGYILQIGVLLTHEEHLLENFGRVFSGAFALMLLSGGSIGFLMARRTLAGIEKVRHSADRISRGDLSQPIPSHGGSVEIENLIHSFNWMQERIQTLISELQGVTNNVAHDLRSPVTRMRGLAETTLTGPQSLEEYRDLASAVIEESDRLVGMINTMLEIAETDAGIRPLSGETVDLTEIVHDVTDLYASIAEDQAIQFNTEITSQALFVTGDRSRLQRAFANLLDNAFKFTPRGGRISISLHQEGDQALLSVVDSGPGISAESLPRIYDRFFRGEQSRTTAGSGLGLSLVKAIIQVHGGQIDVASLPDQGTRFTISLPL